MPDLSPLADQYGSGIYPGLRDPTRSGASRFIAHSVKDPLRGWLEAAQGFLLQTVRNGSNQKRPAQAVWRIDATKRRPFLSQFAGLKGEKVRDFPFQTFRTATESGRSLVSVGHPACCHCRLQLLCGLCLSVGSGSSLAGFFGSIAFLEAGAAARVASLLERRCKIIAAAVPANQASASGFCTRTRGVRARPSASDFAVGATVLLVLGFVADVRGLLTLFPLRLVSVGSVA
jgi:hypothetical protein